MLFQVRVCSDVCFVYVFCDMNVVHVTVMFMYISVAIEQVLHSVKTRRINDQENILVEWLLSREMLSNQVTVEQVRIQ